MGTYKIVQSDNIEDLTQKVNNSMEAGFVCQGGVAITISNATSTQCTSRVLAQAMIYTKEEK